MLVQDMRLQVGQVLLGQVPAVQRLDLILHDIAVLLDVVLLVELVAEGHDILVRDIGIGIELGTGRRVGSLDVVANEVVLLAQVHPPVECFDVFQGRLLVDGHQRIHDLAADFLAGHLVIDEQVVDHGYHHILRDGLAGMDEGQADATAQFFFVELFERAICLADFHFI